MSELRILESDPLRDRLTGLHSMESARLRLEDWLYRDGQGGDGPCVHALLLGLRRIDALNLAYGTATGDAALIRVAARISRFAAQELDGQWLAARSGGANFIVLANEACSRERWQLFAEQLADQTARPLGTDEGALRLSPRVALLRGLAGDDAESLLDRLGQTLAQMQRQQGRRIAWADGESNRPGRTAARLEADLLKALDRDEIEIVFQPQFTVAGNALSGAEALARWNHPKLGRIGAGALFSIAEQADHVVPLSRHIARRALECANSWPEHLRLSLNVTSSDLAGTGFADGLRELVAESGLAPTRLTLEVTEQALIADIQLAERSLRNLAQTGIRIALDDFGAGFCNFRYLKLLPLHYLKLDRSMVDGITSDKRDLAVLRAIVAMARALDLDVIAEGVETEGQRVLLGEEGCLLYQGFLMAQPMSATDFQALAES